jgi:histone acetyltransferase (RNA polymerase elongator complex component)
MSFVEASLIHGLSVAEFREIAESWAISKMRFRETIKRRGGNLPDNDSWNWEDKAATTTSDLHQFIAVGTDAVQGMMMLSTALQLSFITQGCLLYVEYLESAPWNLPEYAGSDARYRGVGSTLLAAAIEVSIAAGCAGRLALHSLPGSRGFYEKAGFERIRFDASENLDWYEFGGVKIEEGGSDGSA